MPTPAPSIGYHYRFRRGYEALCSRGASPHDALALLVAHLQEYQEEVHVDTGKSEVHGLAQAVDEGIVSDIG